MPNTDQICLMSSLSSIMWIPFPLQFKRLLQPHHITQSSIRSYLELLICVLHVSTDLTNDLPVCPDPVDSLPLSRETSSLLVDTVALLQLLQPVTCQLCWCYSFLSRAYSNLHMECDNRSDCSSNHSFIPLSDLKKKSVNIPHFPTLQMQLLESVSSPLSPVACRPFTIHGIHFCKALLVLMVCPTPAVVVHYGVIFALSFLPPAMF